jgi:hypothetical protein
MIKFLHVCHIGVNKESRRIIPVTRYILNGKQDGLPWHYLHLSAVNKFS